MSLLKKLQRLVFRGQPVEEGVKGGIGKDELPSYCGSPSSLMHCTRPAYSFRDHSASNGRAIVIECR